LVQSTPASTGRTRLMNRLHARLAARARPATGFSFSPEPKVIGHYARGRQLLAGNFLFFGELIEAPGRSIWEAADRSSDRGAMAQGFTWLDDLAAVGDARARQAAQSWLEAWITAHGDGTGPGWTPELTGRRLIRWITHGLFLLRGRDKAWSEAYYRSAACQTIFLARRWKAARPGLPRFEALAGLIHAGLSLQGMEGHVDAAVRGLAQDCKVQIGPDGSIPSRNPEELLHILMLLTWVDGALQAADRPMPETVGSAIARIAPVLRALRHADGGLARFHGGGRGLDGWLDQALSASGSRRWPEDRLHLGFGRVSGGRSTLIMDCAPPPAGIAALDAHASTLAIEVTSGRRPLIVNCGNGESFGPEWRRAGRATPSHSTLTLEGYSSARITAPAPDGSGALDDGPGDVRSHFEPLADGMRLAAAHDGYRRSHGLTHVRTVEMSHDGRGIVGEDLLTTLEKPQEAVFDAALDRVRLQGIPWAVRFHLHPEVEAEIDLGGAAIFLTLKSGEIWVFRQDGTAAQMTLEPSVYLETGRLRPRATQQVVLSGRAMSYATRIRWSLAKAQDTPLAIRDVDGGLGRHRTDMDD